MQEVIWSEQRIEGGKPVHVVLQQAIVDLHPHALFPNTYIPSLGKVAVPIVEARRTYYRDIAVVALPTEGTPSMEQVIDLTGKMNADGELMWDAPEGLWSVYRFGHTTTGAMIQPAQYEAMGLECDKMSTEAVTFHCRHVLNDIKKHVGDLIGNPGLSTLYFDSYEAGDPTWTPKMREQFKTRRGRPHTRQRWRYCSLQEGLQAHGHGPIPGLLLGDPSQASARVWPRICRGAL
jgi:hypothetical protein